MDLRLAVETKLYQEGRLRVITQSTKIALKHSCRDRGATRGQPKCRQCLSKWTSTKKGETVGEENWVLDGGGLLLKKQPKSKTSHRIWYEGGQAKSGERQPKSKTEQIIRGHKRKSKSHKDWVSVDKLRVSVNQITYKNSEQKTKKLHFSTFHTSFFGIMFSTSKLYSCKFRLSPNQAMHVEYNDLYYYKFQAATLQQVIFVGC